MIQDNYFYIPPFKGVLVPYKTPFELVGKPTKRVEFIYMTNRSKGRYSYLFAEGQHLDISEVAELAPVGCTQMWIFELLECFHPKENREIIRTDKLNSLFPEKELLSRDKYVNNLYVAIREPLINQYHSDIIGGYISHDKAKAGALSYTNKTDSRTIIAILRSDISWH